MYQAPTKPLHSGMCTGGWNGSGAFGTRQPLGTTGVAECLSIMGRKSRAFLPAIEPHSVAYMCQQIAHHEKTGLLEAEGCGAYNSW